jgi:hypothetical protein
LEASREKNPNLAPLSLPAPLWKVTGEEGGWSLWFWKQSATPICSPVLTGEGMYELALKINDPLLKEGESPMAY